MVVPLDYTHLFLTLTIARQSPCHLRELCFPTEAPGHKEWCVLCANIYCC